MSDLYIAGTPGWGELLCHIDNFRRSEGKLPDRITADPETMRWFARGLMFDAPPCSDLEIRGIPVEVSVPRRTPDPVVEAPEGP